MRRALLASCVALGFMLPRDVRAQEASPAAQAIPAPPAAAALPAEVGVTAPAPAALPAAPASPAPLVSAPAAPVSAPYLPPAYVPYPYQLPPPAWAPRYGSDAPSYVLPPLPAGYAYAPTLLPGPQPATVAPSAADVARNAQLQEELQRVDGRMASLQRDRIGLGGPIAMVVIGYGATLVGVAAGLGSFGAAERIERDAPDLSEQERDDLDFNDDGQLNGRDEELFRRTARVSTGVAAAGLVLGIIGTRRLVERRGQRRVRADELKSLGQRRDSLRAQLDFGASAGPGQVGASLSGRY